MFCPHGCPPGMAGQAKSGPGTLTLPCVALPGRPDLRCPTHLRRRLEAPATHLLHAPLPASRASNGHLLNGPAGSNYWLGEGGPTRPGPLPLALEGRRESADDANSCWPRPGLRRYCRRREAQDVRPRQAAGARCRDRGPLGHGPLGAEPLDAMSRWARAAGAMGRWVMDRWTPGRWMPCSAGLGPLGRGAAKAKGRRGGVPLGHERLARVAGQEECW